METLRPFLFATLLALAAAAAGAHQLGKIQVYATFLKDGTYQIDVPLDPSHLTPDDLGGSAGKTRYGAIAGLKPAADHQFGKLLRAFVDGATLGVRRPAGRAGAGDRSARSRRSAGPRHPPPPRPHPRRRPRLRSGRTR